MNETFISVIQLLDSFTPGKSVEFLPATHPLSPCVLLSGFLYPVLLLFDLFLFSLALIFASVLYDFVGLKITKSSLRSCKQIRTLLFNCNLLHIELPALLFPPKNETVAKRFLIFLFTSLLPLAGPPSALHWHPHHSPVYRLWPGPWLPPPSVPAACSRTNINLLTIFGFHFQLPSSEL